MADDDQFVRAIEALAARNRREIEARAARLGHGAGPTVGPDESSAVTLETIAELVLLTFDTLCAELIVRGTRMDGALRTLERSHRDVLTELRAPRRAVEQSTDPEQAAALARLWSTGPEGGPH